jgi:hypothetical protein
MATKAAVKAKAKSVKVQNIQADDDEDEAMDELTPTQQRRLAKQIAEDDKPVRKASPKTKQGKSKKAKKAQIVSSRNANPEYRTRDVLGEEFGGAPDSLESSVGRQALHCLTVAGQKKNPVWKTAQRLFDTGAAPESKLRELRDVIREHTPDADEDEQENVLARRCCRGLGMVISRMGEEDE